MRVCFLTMNRIDKAFLWVQTCATGTESLFMHPCYTSINTVCLFPCAVRSLPLKEEHWFSLHPEKELTAPNFSAWLGVFWPAVHRSRMERVFSLFPLSLPDSFPVFFSFFIVPARGCPVRKQQGEILPLNAPNTSFKDKMTMEIFCGVSCHFGCSFCSP